MKSNVNPLIKIIVDSIKRKDFTTAKELFPIFKSRFDKESFSYLCEQFGNLNYHEIPVSIRGEIINYAFNNPKNVDAHICGSFFSQSLIHYISVKNKESVLKLLKNKATLGINLNARDNKSSQSGVLGSAPFNLLCIWGDLEILDYFLDAAKIGLVNLNQPFCSDKNDKNCLSVGIYSACQYGHLDFVKKCYESGLINFEYTRPNEDQQTSIYFSAIESGNRSLMEWLNLHFPIDPNYVYKKNNFGLLERAIYSGKTDTFDFVFEHPELNINQVCEGKHALTLALSRGKWTIAKKILTHPKLDLLFINNDGKNIFYGIYSDKTELNGLNQIINLVMDKFNEQWLAFKNELQSNCSCHDRAIIFCQPCRFNNRREKFNRIKQSLIDLIPECKDVKSAPLLFYLVHTFDLFEALKTSLSLKLSSSKLEDVANIQDENDEVFEMLDKYMAN